ncbi:MAG: pyocin knob domain-containing protein [Lacrimispora sp.]
MEEVSDINNPPNMTIFRTTVNPVGLPDGLGVNACLVFQFAGGSMYSVQLAMSYANDKLAIRHRYNSTVWTNWKYFTAT